MGTHAPSTGHPFLASNRTQRETASMAWSPLQRQMYKALGQKSIKRAYNSGACFSVESSDYGTSILQGPVFPLWDQISKDNTFSDSVHSRREPLKKQHDSFVMWLYQSISVELLLIYTSRVGDQKQGHNRLVLNYDRGHGQMTQVCCLTRGTGEVTYHGVAELGTTVLSVWSLKHSKQS